MTKAPIGASLTKDKPDLRFLVSVDAVTGFDLTFDLFQCVLTDKGPTPGEHLVRGTMNYKGQMDWDVTSSPICFDTQDDVIQFMGCFTKIRALGAELILNWTGERAIVTPN